MSAQPQLSAAARPFITPEEYLAAEREAEFKHEYYRGEIYAKAGASNAHTLINGNLITLLNVALRDRDCTVRANDMRLETTAAGLYTYPDVSVVCGEPQFRPDAHLDTLLNPVLLVEVLSKSTEKYDQGSKFLQYRTIPSLQYYVLVRSQEREASVYARTEGDKWTFETFRGPAAVVPLPLLNLELPLSEIYRKVPLTAAPQEQPPAV